MKAVVHDRYGGPQVLFIEEVETPVPAKDQVLVKVHATTVNRTDCGLRNGTPWFARLVFRSGIFRPRQRILGMEFAGEIEAIGAAVTEFAAGDHVFGVKYFDANAEYVAVRERQPITHMPAGVTFEEAAAVCDGACAAMACLQPAAIQEGQDVLIYGASGSIGSAAVQLAKIAGVRVTAVCDTNGIEAVTCLGPDRVIDYTRMDFTKENKVYDVIFDAVGKHSFGRCRSALKPTGIYIFTEGYRNMGWWLMGPLRPGHQRVRPGVARYKKQDVRFLKDLIEAGKYQAMIDRIYPLEDVVEATTYVETHRKIGNVVLRVIGSGASPSRVSEHAVVAATSRTVEAPV